MGKKYKIWTLPRTCVFIDEAGFNLHTQRNFGAFFERYTSLKAHCSQQEEVLRSVYLGAISEAES